MRFDDVQSAGVVGIGDGDGVDAVGAGGGPSAAEGVVGVAFEELAVGVLDGAESAAAVVESPFGAVFEGNGASVAASTTGPGKGGGVGSEPG